MLDLSKEDIATVLDLADQLKYDQRHNIPHRYLEGKNTVLLFEKTSTRTRCAFEVAGRDLGMGVTYLDPLMKVGPQIRRGKRSPEARAKSRSVLERYGLGAETEELYPFELSGGMARRVLISTAVMETPRLVIADEPTPGLDARAAGRILGHFREIADAGAGMLLITHDLELALTIADRVVVFYAGETIEEACEVHGVNCDELLEKLNTHLAAKKA